MLWNLLNPQFQSKYSNFQNNVAKDIKYSVKLPLHTPIPLYAM